MFMVFNISIRFTTVMSTTGSTVVRLPYRGYEKVNKDTKPGNCKLVGYQYFYGCTCVTCLNTFLPVKHIKYSTKAWSFQTPNGDITLATRINNGKGFVLDKSEDNEL